MANDPGNIKQLGQDIAVDLAKNSMLRKVLENVPVNQGSIPKFPTNGHWVDKQVITYEDSGDSKWHRLTCKDLYLCPPESYLKFVESRSNKNLVKLLATKENELWEEGCSEAVKATGNIVNVKEFYPAVTSALTLLEAKGFDIGAVNVALDDFFCGHPSLTGLIINQFFQFKGRKVLLNFVNKPLANNVTIKSSWITPVRDHGFYSSRGVEVINVDNSTDNDNVFVSEVMAVTINQGSVVQLAF